MSVMNYAPVSIFSGEIVDGVLEGYAAPERGLLPCSVGLFSGETAVSYARATRFSEEAEASGVRLGWCGFRLPGLAQALALEGAVEVRCGVTNAVLLKPAIDVSKVERSSRLVRQVSLTEFLTLVRSEDACPDVARLAIFASDHARRHGDRSFLHAAYQTLLGREPDSAIMAVWNGDSLDIDEIERLLSDMVESDELQGRAVQGIPGPFQSSFKFDRGLFI